MAKAIERPKAAYSRVGVGHTIWGENFVLRDPADRYVPGTDGEAERVRPVPLGLRAIGFFSEEIDNLIQSLRRWRDRQPPKTADPVVPVITRRSTKGAVTRKAASLHPPTSGSGGK